MYSLTLLFGKTRLAFCDWLELSGLHLLRALSEPLLISDFLSCIHDVYCVAVFSLLWLGLFGLHLLRALSEPLLISDFPSCIDDVYCVDAFLL